MFIEKNVYFKKETAAAYELLKMLIDIYIFLVCFTYLDIGLVLSKVVREMFK